ncbi:hypothetical protein WJX81_006175 [Elliptochloris bilobata]|uniref:DUF3456 domain-containing protein n=1 Tax=Elliptochloris bilobata TaxID=381761 RepID=A0AAW1SIN2_9CHLO
MGCRSAGAWLNSEGKRYGKVVDYRLSEVRVSELLDTLCTAVSSRYVLAFKKSMDALVWAWTSDAGGSEWTRVSQAEDQQHKKELENYCGRKPCSGAAYEVFSSTKDYLGVAARLQNALQQSVIAHGASGCLLFLDANTQTLHLSPKEDGLQVQQAVRSAVVQLTSLHEHVTLGTENLWALLPPSDAALRAHFFLRGASLGASARADENMAPRNGRDPEPPSPGIARHLVVSALGRESARMPRDHAIGACGALEQLWREHRIVAHVSPSLKICDAKGREMSSPMRLIQAL